MTNVRFPRVLAAAAIMLFAAVVPAAASAFGSDAFGSGEPLLAVARVPYLEGAPTPILLLVLGSLMIGLTLGRKAARSR